MVRRTIEEDRGQEDVPVCVSWDRKVESRGTGETKKREGKRERPGERGGIVKGGIIKYFLCV